MKRRATWMLLIIALGGVASAAPSSLSPSSEEEVERAVLVLLSGYEYVPTSADWASLGSPSLVVDTLLRLGNEGAVLVRHRAMSSLAQFPEPRVRDFLKRVANDSLARLSLRAKALRALGMGFREHAALSIAPYLDHPETRLREAAIRSMEPMSALEVDALLQNRLHREQSPHVRSTLLVTMARVSENRQRLLDKNKPIPAFPKALIWNDLP